MHECLNMPKDYARELEFICSYLYCQVTLVTDGFILQYFKCLRNINLVKEQNSVSLRFWFVVSFSLVIQGTLYKL